MQSVTIIERKDGQSVRYAFHTGTSREALLKELRDLAETARRENDNVLERGITIKIRL